MDLLTRTRTDHTLLIIGIEARTTIPETWPASPKDGYHPIQDCFRYSDAAKSFEAVSHDKIILLKWAIDQWGPTYWDKQMCHYRNVDATFSIRRIFPARTIRGVIGSLMPFGFRIHLLADSIPSTPSGGRFHDAPDYVTLPARSLQSNYEVWMAATQDGQDWKKQKLTHDPQNFNRKTLGSLKLPSATFAISLKLM